MVYVFINNFCSFLCLLDLSIIILVLSYSSCHDFSLDYCSFSNKKSCHTCRVILLSFSVTYIPYCSLPLHRLIRTMSPVNQRIHKYVHNSFSVLILLIKLSFWAALLSLSQTRYDITPSNVLFTETFLVCVSLSSKYKSQGLIFADTAA